MRLVAAVLIAGIVLPGIPPATADTCAQLAEKLDPYIKTGIQLRRQILADTKAGTKTRCQLTRQLVEALAGELKIKLEAEAQRCALPIPTAVSVQRQIDMHTQQLTNRACR
jgi:hypothetical protein